MCDKMTEAEEIHLIRRGFSFGCTVVSIESSLLLLVKVFGVEHPWIVAPVIYVSLVAMTLFFIFTIIPLGCRHYFDKGLACVKDSFEGAMKATPPGFQRGFWLFVLFLWLFVPTLDVLVEFKFSPASITIIYSIVSVVSVVVAGVFRKWSDLYNFIKSLFTR